MPSSNQLNAVLAMPASLRLSLIGAHSRIRPSPACLSSTRLRYYAASKYPNIAAFLIPEFRTSQPAEIPPEELFKTSYISSAPDNPLQEELTALFTKNPPTFQYAESDFYKLKKNTRVPEVCVLGRSNVGKSSFVNALANRHSNVLAYVSSKAGKTKAINTYGFGPAPLQKDLAAQAAEYKGKEKIPTHTFYLVDMPGYGYASLKEWGHNITLYLTKRIGVKGAVLLIDAEVGPKQTDIQLLELLCSAGKRTAIVLTKSDKVKGGLTGLRETCAKLWDAIIEIEKREDRNDWEWEKEIFVTAVGAKDYAVASSTVTTGRLAVARLAGLVRDNRPKLERNQKWSGKVISFEDLQYAPSTSAPEVFRGADVGHSSSKVQANSRSNETPNSAFANLERAAAEEHRSRQRVRPRAIGSHRPRAVAQSHARAFHTSGARSRNQDKPPRTQPPNSQELRDILDDFIKDLQSASTRSSYARSMRQKHDRHMPLPPEQRNLAQRSREKSTRSLQRRFPETTDLTQSVQEKRQSITAERDRHRKEREKERMLREALEGDWSATRSSGGKVQAAKDGRDEDYLTPAAFDEAMVTSPALKGGNMEKEKKKKKKSGGGKKGKKDKKADAVQEPLDDFESKFSSIMGR
ncbi:hypothetical protein F4819DRAFT_453260 [Hypoxylon fuscum]|nr:hypothetical protein F4819DRAFT_453260 [Hypoxylon fuscum]